MKDKIKDNIKNKIDNKIEINDLKSNTGNIIMLLGELLIGIILLIRPIGFTKTIIISVGLVLIILGLINIIKYFKTNILDAMKGQNLSRGLISLVFGLFCTFNSNWFIVTFPVLTIIYGVMILLVGLKKVEWAINSLRLKRKYWYVSGLNSALSVIFAIIVLNNPFTTTTLLWQFTGIVLILESIFDIITIIFDIKKEVSII